MGMLAMIAAMSVFAVNVQGGNVYIYSESFGGSSEDNLHGTAPDLRPFSSTSFTNRPDLAGSRGRWDRHPI